MNMHLSVPASFAEYVIQFTMHDAESANFAEYVIHYALFFSSSEGFRSGKSLAHSQNPRSDFAPRPDVAPSIAWHRKKSSKMGYILGKTGRHYKINAIMDNILAIIDMRTIRALS